MPRFAKQLIIGVVYLGIIGGFIFLYYHVHYAPSCNDGLKNGKEEGIDCGTLACGFACSAPIQPVQVQSSQLVKTPAGDYDFVAQFYNPNTEYGAISGTYELRIGGNRTNYDFYMLPGQTKYIVLTSLKDLPDNITPQVNIKSVQWEKVSGNSNVQFSSTSEKYNTSAAQTTFETNIVNNSNYDFDSVDISAIVTDASGRVLTTNTSVIKTVRSGSSNYVKLTWPFALPADAKVQLEISTNVFDNDNFLKAHGTQEKFQQFF